MSDITGRVRLRQEKKFLILQVEVREWITDDFKPEETRHWRDATLEDLSEFILKLETP